VRAKVKIKLTIPVVVEVTTEWNRRTRQSVIVDAELDSTNLITPRTVYEAMKGGEFNNMDGKSYEALCKAFNEKCDPYRQKAASELPSEEIRGYPMHPTPWGKEMKRLYGAHLTVPVSLVLEVTKRHAHDIVIEPVLGRIATVYIWNVHPEKDVLDTISAHAESMKSPQAERLEEGCLRLRWNR